jgi:formylglycine-generating enzyme required for sulfatase activity
LLREAEWEYAYRAGTRTKFYNGNSDEKVGEIAHYGANTNRVGSQEIGTKAPNSFGLHDMAGNVWEWCSDYWTGRYDMRTTIDPVGPEVGQGCVTRGSCWSSSASKCSATYRSRDAETYGGSHLGFRLARVPSAIQSKDPPSSLDCTGPTGADAKTVVAAQRAWAKYLGEASHMKKFPLDKAGKVTVEMMLLPPGRFYRGSPNSAVIVTLTKPQWVSKYEVTQQQFLTVMGKNPSHFKRAGPDAALCPVEMVSHLDAVKFCKTASTNTGAEYRLLSVAQWEYAYRSGTRTKYYNGDDDAKAADLAQCNENNFVRTAKVGTKLPNAFGLYDMGGNVSEWCADFWDRDYVETRTIDPPGPQTPSKLGRIRVHRGNAWDSYARTCHATSGGASSETYGGSQLGFRLARVASPKKRNE